MRACLCTARLFYSHTVQDPFCLGNGATCSGLILPTSVNVRPFPTDISSDQRETDSPSLRLWVIQGCVEWTKLTITCGLWGPKLLLLAISPALASKSCLEMPCPLVQVSLIKPKILTLKVLPFVIWSPSRLCPISSRLQSYFLVFLMWVLKHQVQSLCSWVLDFHACWDVFWDSWQRRMLAFNIF